jgi:hypothetical protein
MLFCFAQVNGKRMLMPHWIEVADDVTYENITEKIPPEILNWEPRQPLIERFPVPDRPYTITVTDSRITCSCPGNQFRGRCKHVDTFKENHK